MQEELQAGVMHGVVLGERQGFAHETAQSLAQGIVPTLDMIGLSTVFSHGSMLLFGDHVGVRLPEIGIAMGLTVAVGNSFPQRPARRLRTVSNEIRHHLPRGSA